MKKSPWEPDPSRDRQSKRQPGTPKPPGEERPSFGSRLGELLVADGTITQAQLGLALAEQKRTHEKLGTALVRLGFTTESQLVQFLARQYGTAYIDSLEPAIDPELLRLVPARIARKYEVIPVKRTKEVLTLALSDPADLSALDDVAFLTGLKVVPVVAPLSAIHRAITHFYETPSSSLEDVLSEVEADAGDIEIVEGEEIGVPMDLLDLKASATEAPVVRLVNGVLFDAIRRGASDIHLEPHAKALRVRFRIDGMLQEVMTLPKRLEPAVVSRIKIMSNLDIAERRLPQDGSLRLHVNKREVDLRVSILPATAGEDVAIRVLDKEALRLDLAQLGFEADSVEQFRKAIGSPYGMVLITGPTGSGKTTTLYSAIRAVNAPDIKIMTVEDPVEYDIPGVIQIHVKEEIGRTFAAVLRSFLRHDPDVVLVGEMRDLETAQIAIRAALTGHLVFSTLHTNDSPSTVARLLDMGILPFLISAALRLVVAQRLVRKVCPDCREPYQADEESLVPYGHSPEGLGLCTLFKGKGCSSCDFRGMKGRVAIYEFMPVTPEIRDLIVSNASTGEIYDVARQQGMRTLRQSGLLKVIQGITTLEDVLRVTSQ